jgi:uncharacterized protein
MSVNLGHAIGLALLFGATIASAQTATAKDGVDAWNRGDYAGATKSWDDLAKAGDADAQYNLGYAYRSGKGVTADLTKAEDWYRRAALQGHELAQAELGLIMYERGEKIAALPWIRAAADRGEPRAQYVYGTALFNGEGVGKDWPRAYALMTRAAAANIMPARDALGQMDRWLTPTDKQKGLQMATSMGRMPQQVAIADRLPATSSTGIAPVELPQSQPAITASEDSVEPVKRKPTPVKPPVPVMSDSDWQPMATEDIASPPPATNDAPAAIAAPASLANAGGRWRVQLGAFSTAAAAQSAWDMVAGRLPGLSPTFSNAGAITRLQAGPLASKQAALSACNKARAAGSACFPVAP